MQTARLNIFQRTQRLWDTLHPYNAAQAMELTQRFDPATIARAFNQAIVDLNLGTFVVTGNTYTIERDPPPRADLITHDGGLADLLTKQMNLPFDATRSLPFRPFVCQSSTDAAAQTIGLIYQHWPADSVSIRMVMRQWLLRLLDRTPQRTRTLTLPEGGLFHYYGSAISHWSVMQQLWGLVGFASRMKRMRRVDGAGATQGDVAVMLREFRPGLIDAIKQRAKRERVTVGDVFVAALAEACSKHGPNLPTDVRPDLALGTIVDLRGRSGRVPSNVFGLFLGFITSTFAYDELYRFDALLQAARRHRITAAARKSAEASQLNLAIGLAMASWMREPKKILQFYRKRLALAGGISNVNLTHEWPGQMSDVVRAYHRTSPTGPMMPLVVTPTTLGNRLSVCCTYRTGLADQGRPADVLAAFEDRLTRFAS